MQQGKGEEEEEIPPGERHDPDGSKGEGRVLPSAREIVDKMMAADAFSKWLNIEILAVEPGFAKLKMEVRPEMLNGFDIAHGGIAYSLADSALAFAGNGHGKMAVSTGTSISHFKKVTAGEVLVAEAREVNRSNRTALYQVDVTNGKNEKIALFIGSLYITSKNWEL